jgi:hypothetical protein
VNVERRIENARRRGRPSKFGRPGRVVALTLPEDAIKELHRVHHDIGWAIVKLLEGTKPVVATARDEQPDVELVEVGERRALIVINLEAFRTLPGVNIIPFSGNRAFLALDAGRGMSDLELAVIDRLGDPALESRELRALMTLRAQLTSWRHDQAVQFHTRSIIVLERLKLPGQAPGHGVTAAARRPASKRQARASTPLRGSKRPGDDEQRAVADLPARATPGRRRMFLVS